MPLRSLFSRRNKKVRQRKSQRRRMQFERLQARELMAADLATSAWHNAEDAYDVNDDGHVSPLDALIVINDLNDRGPRALTSEADGGPYIDVNGDKFASPADALGIINFLNSGIDERDKPDSDNTPEKETAPVQRLLATTRRGVSEYQLVSLDTSTSEAEPIGRVGYFDRLDAHPTDGHLYGALRSQVFRFDPDSGEKVRLGNLVDKGGESIWPTAITFGDDGSLYFADGSHDLHRVDDLESLSTTLVGNIGQHTTAMEFAPDGTLYGANRGLFTIDPMTAKAGKDIGQAGTYIRELDFDENGTLLAIDDSRNTLFQVDPMTGERTVVSEFEVSLASLASIADVSPSSHDNRSPTARDFRLMVTEDTPSHTGVRSGLLSKASDPDEDPLAISISAQPEFGDLVVHQDGSFTYAPDKDYNGGDQFVYTVEDGRGGAASGVVTVSVSSVKDDPVAVEDEVTVNEDVTAWPIGVTGNDHDADGDLLTVVAASATSGTVTIAADGQGVEYTPLPDFSETDSITYTVEDGKGGTATGTVTVTVRPVNDAPVAAGDTATVREDIEQAASIDVLANDHDDDGDSLTIREAWALHGEVEIDNDAGTIKYKPERHFNGTDTINYTIVDGGGGSDLGTVAVTVTSVNDVPVANDDTLTVTEGQDGLVTVLSNDLDDDGESLAVTIARPPRHGQARVDDDGAVTYVPGQHHFGPDSFTYTVTDKSGASDTATVSITVEGVNDAPSTKTPSSEVVIVGSATEQFDLAQLFEDVDRESLTFRLVAESNRQLLATDVDSENQSLSLAPQNGRQGVARYNVIATDAAGESPSRN